MAEHLPSIQKALGSRPSSAKGASNEPQVVTFFKVQILLLSKFLHKFLIQCSFQSLNILKLCGEKSETFLLMSVFGGTNCDSTSVTWENYSPDDNAGQMT